MRKLPIAVALSAAVHGAALAWVVTRPRPKPEPPRTVTTVEIVEAPPPEAPMAVALLDDHTVSALPATAAVVSHATGNPHGHAAISSGGGAAGKSGHGETPAGDGTGGPRSPLMDMRRGEKRKLVWNPSDKFNAMFDAYDKPPDIPPPPSGELHP